MRRVLLALAFVLASIGSAGPSFGQIDPSDAGTADALSSTPDAREPLPLRLGKAAVFAVVVSALLVAGGAWRHGRRKRRTNVKR